MRDSTGREFCRCPRHHHTGGLVAGVAVFSVLVPVSCLLLLYESAASDLLTSPTFFLDPDPRSGPSPGHDELSAAALLDGQGLAVWQSSNLGPGRVYATRFTLDGQVLDEPAIVIYADDLVEVKGVDVAAAVDRYIVVWSISTHEFEVPRQTATYWQSIRPDGSLIEPEPVLLVNEGLWPQCFSTDPGIVVFWFDDGALYSPTGQLLTPHMNFGGSIPKAIDWNGEHFLIASPTFVAGSSFGTQRLDRQLVAIDERLPIAPWPSGGPSVRAMVSDWLMAWRSFEGDPGRHVVRWGRVLANGTYQGIGEITPPQGSYFHLRLAPNAGGYLLSFRGELNDPNAMVFLHRLDRQGEALGEPEPVRPALGSYQPTPIGDDSRDGIIIEPQGVLSSDVVLAHGPSGGPLDSTTILSRTASDQRLAAIASALPGQTATDSRYLVAWIEEGGSPPGKRLFVRILHGSGQMVFPTRLLSDSVIASRPAVASGGGGWLVVWIEEDRSCNALRLDSQGQPVDPEPVRLFDQGLDPVVAWTGEQFIIACQQPPEYSCGLAVIILPPSGQSNRPIYYGGCNPAIAWGDSLGLLVRTEIYCPDPQDPLCTYQVTASRIDREGAPVGNLAVLGFAAPPDPDPRVTYGLGGFLVAPGGFNWPALHLVSESDGAVTNLPFSELIDVERFDVAWDGESFIVVWESRQYSPRSLITLRAMRLRSDGSILDGPKDVTGPPGRLDQRFPVLASDREGLLLLLRSTFVSGGFASNRLLAQAGRWSDLTPVLVAWPEVVSGWSAGYPWVELRFRISPSEVDRLVGLHVLRAESSADGEVIGTPVRLTDQPLAPRPNGEVMRYRDDRVEAGRSYQYWIEAVDQRDETERLGPVSVFVHFGDPAVHPLAIPNPSRGAVTMLVPRHWDGPLAIYDTCGRLVRRLNLPSGAVAVTWDGFDARGKTVANGLYLAQPGRRSSPAASEGPIKILIAR